MISGVTSHLQFSPHLASPEGEGQIHLTAWLSMAYQIRRNLHLPYGGEREGAEVHWQSNLFLPFGKARMGFILQGRDR